MLLLPLAMVVSACVLTVPGANTVSPANRSIVSEVSRVVDGDTLYVKDLEERVRLIGIDTPEVEPGIECYGLEASDHLRELVPPGTRIEVVFDVERFDRYGRNLGYLYRLSDRLFINLQMVSDGYARMATFPPNVAHVDEFRAAQTEARESNRGLWDLCND